MTTVILFHYNYAAGNTNVMKHGNTIPSFVSGSIRNAVGLTDHQSPTSAKLLNSFTIGCSLSIRILFMNISLFSFITKLFLIIIIILKNTIKVLIKSVGGEGLEPPVSQESGFTVHAATNYRLPSLTNNKFVFIILYFHFSLPSYVYDELNLMELEVAI